MDAQGAGGAGVGSIRVLIVDDHRMVADSLEMLLAGEEGLELVGTAGSAERALELCEVDCPDVVLMDIHLPGMDGIEATRRLRQRCPETQIVAITAFPNEDLLSRVIVAGAVGLVPKTRPASELAEVVRKAADGELLVPSENLVSLVGAFEERHRRHRSAELLFEQLTERELQILQAMVDGGSTEALARGLHISPHTVHGHVRSIFAKLGVHSKLEAVLMALRSGHATIHRS